MGCGAKCGLIGYGILGKIILCVLDLLRPFSFLVVSSVMTLVMAHGSTDLIILENAKAKGLIQYLSNHHPILFDSLLSQKEKANVCRRSMVLACP